MVRLLLIAISISALAAVGLLFALLACALRRWKLASRLAGVSSLTGLFGVFALGLTIMRVWSSSGPAPLILPGLIADPGVDPANRARALVETISLLTNSEGLACLAVFGGATVWLLVHWRLRLAQKGAA
jgi:hypothetical protein